MELKIRWMLKRDLPEVLEIENQEFEFPWEEENFRYCLRQREITSMVCLHDDKIVGYMVYEFHKHRIEIVNFVVTHSYQRGGVGSQMIQKLLKLKSKHRRCVEMCLVEANLPGHLFLKNQGFEAVEVLDEFFEDCDKDTYTSYLFRYNYINKEPLFSNRISQFYEVGEKNEFE